MSIAGAANKFRDVREDGRGFLTSSTMHECVKDDEEHPAVSQKLLHGPKLQIKEDLGFSIVKPTPASRHRHATRTLKVAS